MSSSTIIEGVEYGPLALLIGEWKGNKGMDIAPESDGSEEENPFFEEINFEAIGDVTNANTQKLAVVRYHQKVFRKSDNQQFHDQLGYWLWDSQNNIVMHSISIPRGVTLVAGGYFDPALIQNDSVLLKVSAEENGEWNIAQSPFMKENARTTAFKLNLKVDVNNMSYSQTTVLNIYEKVFDHTDKSSLTRL